MLLILPLGQGSRFAVPYHWELESSRFFLAIFTRIRDQIWIPDEKLAYNQWPPITFCQCIDQMCITIDTL